LGPLKKNIYTKTKTATTAIAIITLLFININKIERYYYFYEIYFVCFNLTPNPPPIRRGEQ